MGWVAWVFLGAVAHAQVSVGGANASRAHAVQAQAGKGMVVSDDRIASEWGAEILRRGGNAVDAAVATAFALAVTRPHFASLGGGGFLVYCPPVDANRRPACQALDYREVAPRALKADLFIKDGKPQTSLSQRGGLASGVPGTPAGLLTALDRWGTRKRSELLRRPIELARSGVRVTEFMEFAASEAWAGKWNDAPAEFKRVFGCGAAPCAPGMVLKQPELARVLRTISNLGRRGFYKGWVAQKIVAGIQQARGVMTEQDLADYAPKLRTPLSANAWGQEIVSMPPPSSGGGVMLQILGFAERAQAQGLWTQGYGSVSAVQSLGFGMALSFADRAEFYGDPDFVPGLVEKRLPALLSSSYLDDRWRLYSETWKVPTGPGAVPNEGDHTTHFSVVDGKGGAVALTTTINDSFGSYVVPPGTGVVMNNEIDDFSLQAGSANLFGLLGGAANSVQPGKRPLSSMTPTITRDLKSGEVRLVLGAAGGPRIISAVAQVILNRLAWGMSLADAVSAHRIHHQWKPEALRVERFGLAPEVRAELMRRSVEVQEVPASLARVHALERLENGRVVGMPDPRGEGEAAVRE